MLADTIDREDLAAAVCFRFDADVLSEAIDRSDLAAVDVLWFSDIVYGSSVILPRNTVIVLLMSVSESLNEVLSVSGSEFKVLSAASACIRFSFVSFWRLCRSCELIFVCVSSLLICSMSFC